MKEKKNKKHKKSKRTKEKCKSDDSDSNSAASIEWVEKPSNNDPSHDEWMSMSGMIKTYTKDDIKPKLEKPKSQIDSYNPSTSSRELNPYWKDGGSGLPQTPDQFRKSKPFMKPHDESCYFSTKKLENLHSNIQSGLTSGDIDKRDYKQSRNWCKEREDKVLKPESSEPKDKTNIQKVDSHSILNIEKNNSAFLSDDKMNKLGAKIIKAEIMGDHQLVQKLKDKLDAAREYRKNNHNEDDGIMLISTSSSGNSCPLVKNHYENNSRSKSGKRKAETYDVGGRCKYFSNDDKYNLTEMFQQEKYGSNYDADAELAKISSKSKNPNDDLEDIFMDEISKNRNDAKDSEKEKQKAINQSVKLEKSLDGCEHCFDSKNMIKHLVISCGNKVYMAVPARKSIVKGHCLITTIQHYTCVTALDEDVWEEVMGYRKLVTQFFNSQNKDVVFYETATKLHRYPHLVINCVPLPRDVGDMASIYFKKGLLECEAEWSMNRKVVDLKGKNIRKGIPKGLPYFWVDFGIDPGFAHIIEDQSMFPKTFAEEIIAGMLDLDHTVWKNPQREYGELQRKKVMEFINEWKPFEKSNKE